MKTYNYGYTNGSLDELINFSLFENEQNVLIQVFCGQDKNTFKKVVNTLLHNIPQAICIGTTTDGEICEGMVSTFQTSISISIFKNTTLKTFYIKEEEAFKSGVQIATELIEPNTKLLILFSDGTAINAEDLLNGIESYNASIPICGGMAGDNGKFEKTYISSQNTILSKGVVGVSLNSDVLQVARDYKFDWKSIGVKHTIDEVQGNRIYKIDGMTSAKFYEKYLKNHASQTEFPLIIEKDGIMTARAVIAKHEDGSLSCAGNLGEGDEVRIGFADVQALMHDPIKALTKLHGVQAETFYIYSCMARRRYMPALIRLEVEPFARLAPTAGFFTYSEFYHNQGHNELLNQTLTVVALSECENSDMNLYAKSLENKEEDEEKSYAKTIESLTNLIQQSARDYEVQSRRLEEQIRYSRKLLASHKQFLSHTIHEINTPLSVIMANIELHDIKFEKKEYLENIEVAVKSIFSLSDDLSYLIKKDQLVYLKNKINLVEFIQKRIDFFEQIASKAESKIHFETSDNPMIIDFNETKLQRIIDNNLSNAIKYTFENKAIFVTLKRVGEKVHFCIKSYSRKIQDPDKIFEEFYREEEVQDGFGLGLNLVKRICKEEKVEITLYSDEEATTFCYIFNLSVL
ncbi:FIST N-terminal domain-containing protein [Sulfurospirillum arcachonense]|uniref:FIST N-terminal domain-containing protein n=1 Tax=Sulfurospirillum arcachonense TaxID=57666 RepID=UPI000467F498|nr:FIST N-terminal domain-containing protein [Sulfurospirillum arcachonense]